MPWTEADREKYAVIRERYASDLSDEEFALISPLLPAASRRGRKRTDPRIILNALFYLIRAGCPWRYLPKDFPAFTTVQNQFYAWRNSGLWTQILCLLVMEARQAEGREASPTRWSSTANRSKRRKRADLAASMRPRKSKAASVTWRLIRSACRSNARLRSPTSRIEARSRRCCARFTPRVLGSKSLSGQSLFRRWRLRWRRGATRRFRSQPHLHYRGETNRQADQGLHRTSQAMGGRENFWLDQPSASPHQGFRGINQVCASLAPNRHHLPDYPKTSEGHMNFESGSEPEVLGARHSNRRRESAHRRRRRGRAERQRRNDRRLH